MIDTKICDSCSRENEVIQNYRGALLCGLCASTQIGTAFKYPESYPFATPRMLAQAIWWLHDKILKDKIEKDAQEQRESQGD